VILKHPLTLLLSFVGQQLPRCFGCAEAFECWTEKCRKGVSLHSPDERTPEQLQLTWPCLELKMAVYDGEPECGNDRI
jgi:hypothetical protein